MAISDYQIQRYDKLNAKHISRGVAFTILFPKSYVWLVMSEPRGEMRRRDGNSVYKVLNRQRLTSMWSKYQIERSAVECKFRAREIIRLCAYAAEIVIRNSCE